MQFSVYNVNSLHLMRLRNSSSFLDFFIYYKCIMITFGVLSVGEIKRIKPRKLNSETTSYTFGIPTPPPQQPHPLLQSYYLLEFQNIKQELGQ